MTTDTPGQERIPFGADPKRSFVPVYLFGIVYVLWLGVLLWMAIFHAQH